MPPVIFVSRLNIWCVQKTLLTAQTVPREALPKTLVNCLGVLPSPSLPFSSFFPLTDSVKLFSCKFIALTAVYEKLFFPQSQENCIISVAFCEPSLAWLYLSKVWSPELHHYSGHINVILKHIFTSTVHIIVLHVSVTLCEFFCDLFSPQHHVFEISPFCYISFIVVPYSFIRIYHNSLIHVPVDGNLNCCQLSTATHNAAVTVP